LKNGWQAPDARIGDRVSGLIHTEHNKDNHELTSKKVSVEVVSGVGDLSTLVSNRVTLLVECSLDRGQADQRGLSSFDDRQPGNCHNQQHSCKGRMNILGHVGLFRHNQATNQGAGKKNGDRRIDILDRLENWVLWNWSAHRVFFFSSAILGL